MTDFPPHETTRDPFPGTTKRERRDSNPNLWRDRSEFSRSRRGRAASVLQASRFRRDVTAFRLDARPRPKTGSEPAFRRNEAEHVYTIEAAHNPEVAGSNPAPATEKGARKGAFRLSPNIEKPGLTAAEVARCAALTCRVSWVNLVVIFAVLYPLATTSVAASSAVRGRAAGVRLQ